MLLSELRDILSCLVYTDRPVWESSRINSFIYCQSKSRKQLKLTDIYRLPYDNDQLKELTKEDIKKIKAQQAEFLKYLNNENIKDS